MSRVALIVSFVFFSTLTELTVADLDPVLEEQVKMLNELTERRRINTFFTNE